MFGIAREVHIQSGFWSFRFEHQRGQDGLGMVTPIWSPAASESIPLGISTRFRMKYADDSESFNQEIVSEFENKILNTTVFALRKIAKLIIAYEHVAGRNYEVTFGKLPETCNELRIFTNVVESSRPHKSTQTCFKVLRTELSNLPWDDTRQSRTAEVMLGFQFDPETKTPVVPRRGQQIFAFLPIQQLPQLPASLSNVLSP